MSNTCSVSGVNEPTVSIRLKCEREIGAKMTAMSTLLESLAALAPPESLARIERGGTAELLAELPTIHAALKAAPEVDTAGLVAQLPDAPDEVPLRALIRGFIAADTADVATLSHGMAGAAGSAQGLGGAVTLLREPEALGAVHRVISKLPVDVKKEVAPILPAPARPLITMATDMETEEFVEMASGVAETLAPPPEAAASSAADNEPEVIVVARRADPVASFFPAGLSQCKQLVGPLSVLARSQLRIQMEFFSREAPEGDPRALALGAAVLGACCGLVGAVGHLVTLQPAATLLSLTLVCASTVSVILDAEGSTAASLCVPRPSSPPVSLKDVDTLPTRALTDPCARLSLLITARTLSSRALPHWLQRAAALLFSRCVRGLV